MDGKSVAKLKEQARTHEQREEWDQAISLYQQVLRGAEDEVGELPLYNRVGDLYLRTGRPNEAVKFYEQAADHYADAGLYNNAIALCNKALRYAPQRVDLLRKLGRFSASQGFLTDARRWFLEYADRAFHKGDVDDAFHALDDFADISNDPEIRELLARKLYAHGRLEDAQTEYRRAYHMRLRDGANDAADALRAEALERYPELSTLDPVPPKHPAHARDAGLPSPDDRRRGRADEDVPPTPEGLPGFDDEPAPTRVAGFEQTSLVSEAAVEETSSPETETDSEAAEAIPEAAPPSGLETTSIGEPPSSSDRETATEARATDRQPHGPETSTAGYVDLSDLLGVSEDEPKATRFFVQETDPTGDEDRDFAELLAQFKQKIAENVAHDDIGSHYDLGLAFKEMGLLDEAIGQFQVALRGGDDSLKIFEELGQCFLLKRQFNIAVKVLSRAMQFEPDDEIELIGVYYHLGRAYEELGQREKALDAYERVMGLDIGFKDVSERMASL